MIETLPSLKETMAQCGFHPRKDLGQNFLLDLNITRKIVRLCGDLTGRFVIEVGPGPGGLTRALLESPAQHVMAIDKDPRAACALETCVQAFPGRLTVSIADALRVPVHTLGQAPRLVVANLPYNVATPLLMQWLEHASDFEKCILMFQKEVGERLSAQPHTSAYGRLSVMAQMVADIRPLMHLPPDAFYPPPQVHSMVVEICPLPAPRYAVDQMLFARLVQAGFAQRRKMLRSALKSLGPNALRALERTEIEGTRRAETLCLEEFARLTQAYTLETAKNT